MSNKPDGYLLAIGLMSGTSVDGVDVASLYVSADGKHVLQTDHQPYMLDYSVSTRSDVIELIAGNGNEKLLENKLTQHHAQAVEQFLQRNNIPPSDVYVIGFHGQTVLHDPNNNMTKQLGDGQLLSKLTGIDVVYDFRSEDVAQGGQGAPLLPIYHQLIMEDQDLPIIVVNIGGVANITWIGPNGQLMACDTGPGNALIDDMMERCTGRQLDMHGQLAAKGIANQELVDKVILDDYLSKSPPKSLDRNHFHWLLDDPAFNAMTDADIMATLTEVTAQSIILSGKLFPDSATKWVITGGGRHNQTLMMMLKRAAKECPVVAIESLGFNGDAIEAQGFALLAVLSQLGLPYSFPHTTGVSKPCSGGILVDHADIMHQT
mgnify:CR=1 FL=1